MMEVIYPCRGSAKNLNLRFTFYPPLDSIQPRSQLDSPITISCYTALILKLRLYLCYN